MERNACSLTIALLLACATPGVAQHAVAGFGLGWGRGIITCTLCSSGGTYDGVAINFSVGKTVNPRLRVLFNYDEWGHPPQSGQSDLGKITETFTGSGQFFPWTVRHGFFLEGGLGVTVAKMWVTDTSGFNRHGWGLTVGAGDDLFPGRSFSATPRVAFSYGSVGRIYYPLHSRNLWADGWKHEILSVGLGLTFHKQPTGDSQKGVHHLANRCRAACFGNGQARTAV
jgi:hypothetical protein